MDKIWKIGCLVLALLVVTNGVFGVASAETATKEESNDDDIDFYWCSCVSAFGVSGEPSVKTNGKWKTFLSANDWDWNKLSKIGVSKLTGSLDWRVSPSSSFEPDQDDRYEIRVVAYYKLSFPFPEADRVLYSSGPLKDKSGYTFSKSFTKDAPKKLPDYPYQELDRIELQVRTTNFDYFDRVKFELLQFAIHIPYDKWEKKGEWEFDISEAEKANFIEGDIRISDITINDLDDYNQAGEVEIRLNGETLAWVHIEDLKGYVYNLAKGEINVGENTLECLAISSEETPSGKIIVHSVTNKLITIPKGKLKVKIKYEPYTKPDPKIEDVAYDDEIDFGEWATIKVWAKNEGEEANWQTISISSPAITDSNNIKTVSSDLDSYRVWKIGETMNASYGVGRVKLTYPVAEGTSTWHGGDKHYLQVKVKPEKVGKFPFYVKTVAGRQPDGKCVAWDPTSGTKDQQHEYVKVYTIEVIDPVTDIDVKPDSWTMDVNDEKQFEATATHKSGKTEDMTSKASWSTSNSSVLKHLRNGKFKALKEGSATVTAIYEGKSDSSDVTIYPITHFYTFQTTDNAMKITIDGSAYNSPHTEQWKDSETHEISVPPEQAIVRDKSKYVFTQWSGKSSSTSTSLQITAGSTTAGTYTANYKTQYYLTVNTEPEGLTTISGSGWYDAGSTATTGKAPDNVGEYEFSTWKVDGNPVSGNSISVTMNDAHTATACYVPIGKPDLTLSPSDITFSNPYPTEGDIVKIIATIHNIGNKEAISANVKFYDGDPDNGGVQIDATQSLSSIPPSGTKDASVDWNTTGKAGEHTIYVVIADCSPEEASTEYNEASKDIIIGRYGVDLSCANPEKSIPSGGYATYNITVKNTGNVEDTIKVTTSLPPLPLTRSPWTYSLDKYSVELSPGESTEVVLTVSDISDKGLPAGSSCEVEVIGISQGDPTKSDSVLTKTTIGDWNPWNDPDSEGGESVTTAELQEAIHCWLNDEPAPKTGAEITTASLQEVIHQWLVG